MEEKNRGDQTGKSETNQSKNDQEDAEEFGLPEVKYNPIKREEASKSSVLEESKNNQKSNISNQKTKASSRGDENQGAVIAFVIIFFLLLGAGIYLFVFDGWDRVGGWFGNENPTTQMENQPLVEDTVEEEEENFGGNFEEDTTQSNNYNSSTSQNTQPQNEGPAKITTLTNQNGRSYIIVGSFLDDDLAMDYAEELKSNGKSSFILKPETRNQMTRVAIKEYGSFTQAMSKVDSFRNEYGNKTWVLKY